MEEPVILFSFKLFGHLIDVPLSLGIQWIIMLLLLVVCIIGTRNLKTIPNKRQNILEMIVEAINNLVRDNMGEKYMSFVPFIGTMAIFILLMNLAGLFGVEAPTTDYSVAVALAAISFVVIQGYAIKKNGVKHYFLVYKEPIIPMLPLNIMERIMFPVSLSLRLFGNMMAGGVIIGLLYKGLGSISWVARIGIPVAFHGYFDLFDGSIQMIIFIMLTMINIKIIAEE